MNIAQQIKRHEDIAEWYASRGFSKRAAAHLRRIVILKNTRQIKRECKLYRDLDDSVNADDEFERAYTHGEHSNAAE